MRSVLLIPFTLTTAMSSPAATVQSSLPPPLLDPAAIRSRAPNPGPTLDMRIEADPALVSVPASAMCATTRAYADYDQELRARLRNASAAPGATQSARPLPTTYIQNGIIVIEDNGTVLNHDNLFDLAGRSMLFTPAGAGFTARSVPLAPDPDPGTLVIDNQTSFVTANHSLAFSFPFGSATFSEIWVTTNLGIFFAAPAAPGPSQLLRNNVLFDRTPRIGPVIMGSSLRGYSVYVREDLDRVVVTWRAGGVDVQTTLFANGDILMSWSQFDFEWGALTIVTGNPGFWAAESDRGIGADPLDVTLGTPEDLAIDVVAVNLRQVADRDIFYLDLTLAGPIPLSPALLYYDFALPRFVGDPNPTLNALYYRNGVVEYNSAASVEILGDVIRFGVVIDPDAPPVAIAINTWHWNGGWQWADYAEIPLVAIPSIQPTMLDLSVAAPVTTDGPLFEAFTLPELLPYEVERVVRLNFGDLGLDGLPIYQNLFTDIIFYAGGYSTVGNAGADGIGVGNSTDPVAPALLHQNRIGYGWNTSRPNRLLLLNQEFGHHWLYFARIDDMGMPSTIVNPDGAHYAGWVHTLAAQPVFNPDDSSSLGGSTWTELGGGRFQSSPAFSNFAYNWADLYLLGLADPTEVDANGEWWYIKDPVPSPPSAYWPAAGSIVDSGSRVDLSIQQIIDNHGPRIPAYPMTKRDMVAPLILIGRPGQIPASDVDALRGYCDDWVIDWSLSTLARSTVTCAGPLNQAPDGVIAAPPGAITINVFDTVDFAGNWTDPNGDPVTWLWTFDGQAPDATVQNPGILPFPNAGVYNVCLTVTDQPGLLPDPEPACVEITVKCAPPNSLGNTLLMTKDDPATVRAYWVNQPSPTEYPLFASSDPGGPFANEIVAGSDGIVGEPFPLPTEPEVYYRVAARVNGCLGRID